MIKKEYKIGTIFKYEGLTYQILKVEDTITVICLESKERSEMSYPTVKDKLIRPGYKNYPKVSVKEMR